MSIFNSVYAEQYDDLYLSKDYRGECDVIEKAINRYGSGVTSTVLDIGCGTGEHSFEMARRGYELTGIDLSQSMLKIADEKAVEFPELARQPKWLLGDARFFEISQSYDLGIMMFAVIGYLTTNADVLAALRNIRRHLKLGALFICDFWSGPSVLSMQPSDQVRVMELDDCKVIRTSSTNTDIISHTAQINFNLWKLDGGNLVGEVKESHRIRYFFPQEFALLLEMSGFELKNLSAFPSLDDPLTATTRSALVVAVAVDSLSKT